MKKFLSSFLGCILILGTASAIASGPGWTQDSTVIKIVITSNGGINIRLSPELSGCTSQSGYGPLYASVYPDHPGLNKIHSNLLTAYMSGKPVAMYLVDSTCKVGEVELGGRG